MNRSQPQRVRRSPVETTDMHRSTPLPAAAIRVIAAMSIALLAASCARTPRATTRSVEPQASSAAVSTDPAQAIASPEPATDAVSEPVP
ncbi:MAG: hypothetical protein ACO3IB_07840, partial [Phycisphaerales bacterium]